MTSREEPFARNALAWAQLRLDATDYGTRCLAFVEDALERSNAIEIFGGDYAAESARQYGAAENSGVPPLGAFVFYDATGEIMGDRRNWGHVGLSFGDGRIIHAWDRVRIDHYSALEALPPAIGWEPMQFAGWAPIATVLKHSFAKVYIDDNAAARMQAARFSWRG